MNMITLKFFMVQPMSENNNGFVALIAVLVLSAVGVSVGISLILLGLGSSRSSFALEQSNHAKALANACAEEALLKLKQNLSYAGNETLTFTSGTCQIQDVKGTGPNRIIKTTGTVGTIIRKVAVKVKISPSFELTSWQEVADF